MYDIGRKAVAEGDSPMHAFVQTSNGSYLESRHDSGIIPDFEELC